MNEAAAPRTVSSGAGMTRVLSDERLARRAAAGDERAFAAIFDRYHQALYRYCLAIVSDPQDAQDALQNAMVKVLRALPGEQRRIELKPWLYRIAHNESIELLRRRRETRQLDPELATPGSGLVDGVASRERLRRLISDLDELPERQRGALVMRELGGLDFAEIGSALGTSAAVARQTLYEARRSLRQMDEGRGMSCATVTRALSDGDGRVTRRRDVRAHLRTCASCRRFGEEIERREVDLAALSPLPALAAAGLLQGLLGGHGAAGGGLAGALGGGAAKSLGASAALKGAATVAVVAAIGVGTADRAGLIAVGPPGGGDSQTTQTRRGAEAERAASQPAPTAGSAARAATAGSAVGGDGRLGASRATKTGAGKALGPGGGGTSPAAIPVPAVRGSAGAPAPGRGHAKELPSASAHGQRTAAAHKTAHPGPAGTRGQPASPAKPAHPAHPSNPGPEKPPSSPPPASAGPNAHSRVPAAPPPAGGEEAPSGHLAGKP
jgi:RNA polymerase sigma factor (sigma-70 family)